ncbi:small s [Fusarium beomiforme]|uniref:Small s n=1 Tax=Fusarium beomiforme TaxID=44412 RepID=A0A9P5DVJ1_9HYPO|nr:small s [Fusarium beomiforme]
MYPLFSTSFLDFDTPGGSGQVSNRLQGDITAVQVGTSEKVSNIITTMNFFVIVFVSASFSFLNEMAEVFGSKHSPDPQLPRQNKEAAHTGKHGRDPSGVGDDIEATGGGDSLSSTNSYSPGGAKAIFKDVSFAYPSRPGVTILDNVSFILPPNQFCGLVGPVGPSGADKSTIMNNVQRLYEPTSGSVLINHQDVIEFSTSFRDTITLVPPRYRPLGWDFISPPIATTLSMAEAVGTALEVVGVLGQLFDGCIRSYSLFTAAANIDTDSQRLLCKVCIEEMRLVFWGRDWGVAEGRLEAHLESTRNPQLRTLALQILEELHSAATDFKKLKDRTYETFNDGLERLFPTSHLTSFQRAWMHQLLESAKREVTQLTLLETASNGLYPKLTKSANLKKLRINLDAKTPGLFQANLRSQGTPCCAGADAGDVLIEWVDYDRDDVDERVVHVRRLDDLARMMHSAPDCHPDLHSIDSVGYVDDTSRYRYGLVYKVPSPSFSTLHELITSSDLKTLNLDDRVRLA